MSGKRFKKDKRRKLRERKQWDKNSVRHNPTIYTNFEEDEK